MQHYRFESFMAGVENMKTLKTLLVLFLVIPLSGCFQKDVEIKFHDLSYKSYIKVNTLNVGYSVEIENNGQETFNLLKPRLVPEIEGLVSNSDVITKISPNSTSSVSATFTVDVSELPNDDRKKLLEKQIIKGFYLGKYFDIKTDKTN